MSGRSIHLINRDELLATLEQDINVSVTGEENMKAVRRCLQEILDDVKNSPVMMEWIPVKERLPEYHQMCLCSYKGAVVIDRYIGNGGAYEWDYFIKDYEAWMPLPEPYKEGEEHEDIAD